MTRGAALAILLASQPLLTGGASATPSARATIDLADTPADLRAVAGWTTEPADVSAADAGVLISLRGPGSLRATVVRLPTPNPRAWIVSKRDAYVAEVVAGFAASAAGPVTPRRPSSPVPTLDVDLVRAAPRQAVRARVLLFRTYTLALIIVASKANARAHRRAVETMREALALPSGWSTTS